ncbi:MAG: CRISPR-associated helicase Cas3' [Planctomycetia bacterium]|nr:CRISPR-associated helicase Cas3' [Planctomycetia bacterium]
MAFNRNHPTENHPTEKARTKVLSAEECLAKTVKGKDGTLEKGCDVPTHLKATFRVGQAILNFLEGTRAGDLLEKRDLLGALLHDLGKLTPAFQEKIYGALGMAMNLVGTTVLGENHATASRTILKGWKLYNLANLVGDHHGRVCTGKSPGAHLGQSDWKENQRAVAEALCREFGLELEDVPYKWGSARFRLVQGLTSLADWLSSGLELEAEEELSDAKIQSAISRAGFVPFRVNEGLSFEEIFGFPPFAVQSLMAEKMVPGGVYVLETEMGGGKTEAALYLAYRLLEKERHNGIYFALPTQLTSDKIHERFKEFLKKILPAQASRRALLLHGQAWLRNELYSSDGTENEQRTVDRDAWFDHRKRGLLAPFAVGTVDQILMAVINVRYNFMRAFGAAGKVIILDEIHSYDAYTGTLIQALIKLLREMHCTVILLSATLTRQARNDLLGNSDGEPDPLESCYPLLSYRDNKMVRFEKTPPPPGKTVSIFSSRNLQGSIDRALEKAENGESVLWIENTVHDAQKVFRMLRARAGKNIQVGLIHSRFPSYVRSRQEKYWTELYGKNVTAETRSGGKILIGTQVLEQSIDIDADYLITRLCPTDMLLQRIGRLWRHRRLDAFRPPTARCVVEILNEEPYENRPEYQKPPHEKHYVYAPYVLVRSQEVWESRSEIVLPRDMRTLLEETYAEREETGYYQGLKEELEKRKDVLKGLAHLSQGDAERTGKDEEGLGTRYNERPMVELLLLEDYDQENGRLKLHGREDFLTLPGKNATPREKFLISRILIKHLIRVPECAAPPYESFPLGFLSHLLYIGRNADRPLRAAFIAPSGGSLRDFSQNPVDLENYEIGYCEEIGYFYTPKKK